MQVNDKAIKFRKISCTDCGERGPIKISESAANPKRHFYKCERLGCDYFRWWEHLALAFEYKVIVRGLGKLQDEEENQTLHHKNKKLTTMTTMLVTK